MIRESLIRLLGGRPVRAAAAAPEDDSGWRAVGGERRGPSPLGQAEMRRRALALWEGNVLARQLVEMPIAWLLADGVRLCAPDREAQRWLDAFWRDPVTDMRRNLPRMMREMALFGEQFWPVFVDPASGHVRLGYLDPGDAAEVVADPDNAARPIGVATAPDAAGRARRYRAAVAGPEEVFGPAARRARAAMADGECFLFQRNRLMTASRGRSDLAAAFDWLEEYEGFLGGERDRAGFLRAFVWDVEVAGIGQEEAERRAAEIGAPEPGSVRVHNEAERWRALAPDLRAEDAGRAARLFRNHILSGQGWPEHWFGGGGDVNRATAAEMGSPAIKMLSMRQREWTAILEEVGAYVVRRRLDPAGESAESRAALDPALAVSVEWPEMAPADEERHARALARVVDAAARARDRGLLSAATAVRLVAAAAARLGVAFDPAEELAAARAGRGREAGAGTRAGPSSPR